MNVVGWTLFIKYFAGRLYERQGRDEKKRQLTGSLQRRERKKVIVKNSINPH